LRGEARDNKPAKPVLFAKLVPSARAGGAVCNRRRIPLAGEVTGGKLRELQTNAGEWFDSTTVVQGGSTMLQVTKEPRGLARMGLERCCLCREHTPFWYTPKDVALCRPCAKTATADRLPTKEEWVAKERARRGELWACNF